jgi:hypothetical protein
MVRADQVEEYFRVKGEYLKAHGAEKAMLKAQIAKLRKQIAEWAHPGEMMGGFDWEVEFAEVFVDGGFDVILTNPPYVRQELIKDLKPTLKSVFPEVYVGTGDLYVYFYARALQLLRPGGMLAFISSNTWFRTKFGTKLRKHISETCHVTGITDFGDLPVFQSAAAYPMIFTAQKERSADGTTILAQVESLASPYPDVAALVREVGQPLMSDALTGSDWALTDAATADRLRKMRAYHSMSMLVSEFIAVSQRV